MADYNANIKVNADTRDAEQAIKRLTAELNKIQNISTAVKGVKNIGEAFVPQQALTRLEKGLQTIASRANTTEKVFARLVEGVGTLGASGAVLEGLNQALTGIATTTGQSAANFSGAARKIDEFASAGDSLRTTLAQVNNLLVDVGHEIARVVVPGFAAMDDTAQATAQTANKLQYALQQFLDSSEGIRAFVSNIGTLQGAAGAATVGLTALAAVVEGQLSEALYDIDASASTALKQLADDAAQGASELQRLIRATQGTVEQYDNLIAKGRERLRTVNAESDEARRAANTITQGQKLLNTELERQNDLLREARGLRPQTVENKATNTYNVTQRRKTFLKEQASDIEALNESLRRLESRQINWADALGIDAIEGAARNADRLSQAWTKNQQALTSWEGALREGGQWLKELQASMRTDAADAYTRALLNQQRTLDAYADSAAQARRAIEGLGYTGETPALRPAGFTDQDVRIKNLLDDQEAAAKTIFNLENEFNKKVHFTELEFIQKELEAEIDKIEAIGAAQKKADSAALKDFDARLKDRTEKSARRREMTENVIIGGAFPMLFGGGLGAVAGGALGGLIPGNPMLSVATSAVGALVDQFVASVTEAGSAMRDPITNFQKLADAGLIASRSQKQYIERLIEAGRVTEAAAAMQAELVRKIGAQGVQDLQNAGAASDSFNKKLAELNLQMQAAVAGPLTDLLTWLNTFLAGVTAYNRQQAAQTDFLTSLRQASPQAYQQYFKESIQLREANNGVVNPQAIQRLQQQYTQRFNLQPAVVSSSIDRTPELKAQAQTRELAAQVELEAKKLSLVGRSLEQNGQAYIAAAKAVALQEYENRLLEIKNSWIGKAFDVERNRLLITQANLQYAGKLKAIDAEQLKALENQRDARAAILGLQAELLQTTIAAADIDVEFARLRGGEAAAIQEEVNQLNARFNVEAKILDLQTQQKLLNKDITTQQVQLINSIYKEQLANLKAQYDIRVATRKEALALIALNKFIADTAAKQQAIQPFEDLRKNRELEIQYGKTYLRLVTEGILPAEADRIANFERLVAEQLNALDKQIAITRAALVQAEAYGASADKVKELREELERLEGARGAVTQQAAAGPGEGKTSTERLQEALATAKGELNDLTDPINQVIAGAKAIGDAFQQAFKGLVSGAMTGQEALAAFFKGIGDHFMDMASKMIAKLIEIYILETVLGFISGAAGAGGGAPRGTPGAVAPNGLPYFGPAFAEGGFVTGPTQALIGEGGEPEYVIPASKMRTAMGRYSAGARGSSVVSGSSGQISSENGGSTATMEPIDVRYSIERINNVDYVTAEQFQRGLAQAAQQGAIQGERRAMRSLKNSAATRKGVGI